MTSPLIDTLVPMNLFAGQVPVSVDLVYANPVHARNIFAARLYHPGARLWLHQDLAKIVLCAALKLNMRYGWTLQLKDGLRTIEAQKLMEQTDIVQANPHWTIPGEKRLLSPPGAGAHPRGMAIDICVVDAQGREIDMGTPFDYLSHDADKNPAARDYADLPDEILERRLWLTKAMTVYADKFELPLVPLASEWWDYRFPGEMYNQYDALSDADLPAYMQMTGRPDPIMPPDIEEAFDKRARAILNDVHETLQNPS